MLKLDSWGDIMKSDKSDDKEIKKEDDTMSAVARNYVYEMKVKSNDEKKEKAVSEKILAMCKEVASKYSKK